jgi:tetratricopeptide (TPR) repeat protein
MTVPRVGWLVVLGGAAWLLCGAARPKDAEVQLRFGVDMAKRGAWKEAEYRFRRALELSPRDAAALNDLAVACENNGSYEEAERAYVQALEVAPEDRSIRENFERFRVFYAEHLGKHPEGEGAAASKPPAPGPS